MTRRQENGSSRTYWQDAGRGQGETQDRDQRKSKVRRVSKAGTYTVKSWVKRGTRSTPNPASGPTQRRIIRTTSKTASSPESEIFPWTKLTTIQIQRFYNNLQKTDEFNAKTSPPLMGQSQSQSGSRRPHAAAQLPEQAVAERLLLTNPAQGCKLPQLEKREMKFCRRRKSGMYLAEAERRGLLSAFCLELTTGLRRGSCWPSNGRTWTLKTGQSPSRNRNKPNPAGFGGQSAENTQLCADAGPSTASG